MRNPAKHVGADENTGGDVAGYLRDLQELDQVPDKQSKEQDETHRSEFIHCGCSSNSSESPRSTTRWETVLRDSRSPIFAGVGERCVPACRITSPERSPHFAPALPGATDTT